MEKDCPFEVGKTYVSNTNPPAPVRCVDTDYLGRGRSRIVFIMPSGKRDEKLFVCERDGRSVHIAGFRVLPVEWGQWFSEGKFAERNRQLEGYYKKAVEYVQFLEEGVEHPFYHPEELTCVGCILAPECRSAWDDYNTNGECLEDK